MKILGAIQVPEAESVKISRPYSGRVAVLFDMDSMVMSTATYEALVAAVAADQRAIIEDEPPVEVDAFINLRQRPARAIARGDWVDVGDHDFRQVVNKQHGHPVSVFTVDGADRPYAWSLDSIHTIADRVTDCEGSTMPDPAAWDVV